MVLGSNPNCTFKGDKMLSILAGLLLTLLLPSYDSEINTASLSFVRKVSQQGGSVEIVKGTAYYTSPHRIYIEVESPITQIMVVDGKILTIYYPDKGQAFRIKSKTPMEIPILQPLLLSMKDDHGLTGLGYTLRRHERKGNKLYSYWKPPKELEKKLDDFTLVTEDDVLIYAETRAKKGDFIAKSYYSEHARYGGKRYPCNIKTVLITDDRTMEEDIQYTDVKFNIALPKKAINFELPETVTIKEVELPSANR